ncbi:MAG TPA: HEPN/Toprim-associated domain-containing protein [Bryobacteraceae bacterium]
MRHPQYGLSVEDALLFRGEYPDDEIMSVFDEEDRQVLTEDTPQYLYSCSVGQLCDRLDVMGFTLSEAARQVTRFAQHAGNPFYVVGSTDSAENAAVWKEKAAEERLLRTSTFGQWRETYIRLITEWNKGSDLVSSGGPLDRYLFAFYSEDADAPLVGIRSPFEGSRYQMRAMLSAFRPDATVRLDFTPLVAAGLIDPRAKLSEAAIEKLLVPATATAPIVVLTEGKTDTRILSKSLERLFPHLRRFYTFLDHEGFAPPPGAGNIVNMLKGLAASKMSNRVIAVFDNDAAGTNSATAASKLGLPKNFRILQLPHLQQGKHYSTLGPSGAVAMDINGSACGLELYLGKRALTGDDGGLLPVRWTGYEQKLGRYQGELSNKQHAQDVYLAQLERSTDPTTDPEFDDMRSVLRAIMNAFLDKARQLAVIQEHSEGTGT